MVPPELQILRFTGPAGSLGKLNFVVKLMTLYKTKRVVLPGNKGKISFIPKAKELATC